MYPSNSSQSSASKVPRAALWQGLFAPSARLKTLKARQSAQLLAVLALILVFSHALGGFTMLSLMGMGAADIEHPFDNRVIMLLFFLAVSALLAYGLSRSPYPFIGALILAGSLSLASFGLVLTMPDAVSRSVLTILPLAFVIVGTLMSQRALMVFIVTNVLGLLFLSLLDKAIPFAELLQSTGIVGVIGVMLLVGMVLRDNLEHTRLAQLETANQELRALQASLEQKVEGRTLELAQASTQSSRRAAQLQTIAEVARVITSIQDLQQLLPRITQSISERFGFYHVGIFLIDPQGGYAVLKAANSAGGQRMLARQHQLAVGQVGIVGFVTQHGEPRIALDVGQDAVFFENPDLPDTRSEMALPLKSGEQIIGALDVQSEQPQAFSREDVSLLQILADQVSVAIENARLYGETHARMDELQSAQRLYQQTAWERRVGERSQVGFTYQAGSLVPIESGAGSASETEAGRNDAPPVEAAPASEAWEEPQRLLVPINLRGQSIGLIDLGEPTSLARVAATPSSEEFASSASEKVAGQDQPVRRWSADEITLVQAVADQVALALENARLIEETQQRAERERLVAEITGRLRRSNDPQVIIQTAVTELRHALRAKDARVLLPPSQAAAGAARAALARKQLTTQPGAPGLSPLQSSGHGSEPRDPVDL